MKYTGMPMGMWVLFGKSFERNLITESYEALRTLAALKNDQDS